MGLKFSLASTIIVSWGFVFG